MAKPTVEELADSVVKAGVRAAKEYLAAGEASRVLTRAEEQLVTIGILAGVKGDGGRTDPARRDQGDVGLMANPKVEIRPVRRSVVHGGHNGDWVVWCRTGDCEYADTAVRKTEAQALQRKHVRGHRLRLAERRALNRPEGQ